MSELKKKMNLLATKYKELGEKERNKAVKEISEMLEGFVYSLRRKFKREDLNKIDYESVASLALLKALNKYNEDAGNFDSYYGTWIRSDVTREMINHVPNVKLPEYLSKPLHRMLRDVNCSIDNPKDKELIIAKYRISESDYDKIIHYRQMSQNPSVLYTGVEEDHSKTFDIQHDVQRALEAMFEGDQYEIVCHAFGLQGREELNKKNLALLFGKDQVDSTLNTVLNSKVLKRLLGDYDEQ